MRDAMFHDALDDLPESGADAYATVDARGVLTSWSPGAQHLLGYTAEEVRGRSGLDLLYARSDAARIAEGSRALRPAALGQVALRHRDGSRVEVGMWVHPLVTTEGESHWLLQAESADAVRRKNLGRALLRGLFTESPFHIDVFDTDLRFVAQNARRLKGFKDQDFLGRPMRDVAPPGMLDMAAFEARQRQVLATGEALVATEVRARPPDAPDRQQAFSETIVPLRSESGEVIGLAHAVFEVTDRVRARERLALVNEASAKIGSTLDVLYTARELTDVVVPVFADHAYVNLLDPVLRGQEPVAGPVTEGTALRRAASSSVPEGPAEPVVATGDIDPFTSGTASLFARALASGEAMLLTGGELAAELALVDPQRAALVHQYGVHSWLLVPMYARGAALGTAVFLRFRGEHPFEADDVLLAQDLVARAAVCIDNARRYTRERRTALTLQRSLLPQRMPVLGTVQTASRYLPANGEVLGGAWFDVIPLSSARVALSVGVVAGRGLHSAVTMGRLRTAVRTLADLDLTPEELLTHLDDQVTRSQDEHTDEPAGGAAGTRCTYAVFDPITRRCAMAQAGQPPPARVSTEGQVELLDLPSGPPLGHGGAPFASGEVPLNDDELLVLYTGGPADVRDPDTDPHVAWLRESLSDHHLTASTPLDDICNALIRHLPTPRSPDDLALLVARVRALDPHRHITWELPTDPEIVGEARKRANHRLAEWGLQDLEFATELIVSELVTNAIRYGSQPIRLRLIQGRNLICEVSDGSSTSPHIRRALETDEGGRGLYMVAQFAQLWGTRYHSRGKTIWAEQPKGVP